MPEASLLKNGLLPHFVPSLKAHLWSFLLLSQEGVNADAPGGHAAELTVTR